MGVAFAVLAGLLFLSPPPPDPPAESCTNCHVGIEKMHKMPLACTVCHGGDGKADTKEKAHVKPRKPLPNDERVLPRDFDDVAYLRFVNPTDLRAVSESCGGCHGDVIDHLETSLHASTAGHLSDGLYENGVTKKKEESYSIFRLGGLRQIPEFKTPTKAKQDEFAAHYLDLPRKACMQCHLWSEGRAVEGRLGMDGDYRSQGCAACHVTYADDGLSRSADPTIPKLEPGHPLTHEFTTRPPTDTCTRCHYGDASIGLSYRGLAQLAPGMPAGPDVKGTTASRLNGVFYLKDPGVNPPDIHHEKGMHCIDCHTAGEVMGDGKVYTKMEQAVEIECADCHGTFTDRATLVTSRGTKLEHMKRLADGRIVLTSKVTGKEHPVPQTVDAIAKNPRAAAAMRPEHARLECYACHSGWSPNFFAFHFDRNEQFTQLEILSGERTPGRVTTQEKVFATFRNFYLGWSPEGEVSPFMVGFSTMGTVHAKDGRLLLDQALPVTAAGLYGMSLVHHQLLTVRPTGRACVECHRAGETLGLGSPNFRLAREFVVLATGRGLETVAFDRANVEKSVAMATLELVPPPPMAEGEGEAEQDAPPRIRGLAVATDPVRAELKLAAVVRAPAAGAGPGGAGGEPGALVIVDLRNPAFPEVAAEVPLPDARDVAIEGRRAYVAAGTEGLVVVLLAEPARPKVIGRVKAAGFDARKLVLADFYAYVLDASSAIRVIDLGSPSAPREVAKVDLDEDPESMTAGEVAPGSILTFFQYGRPRPNGKGRTPARRYVTTTTVYGTIRSIDATEPTAPVLLPRAVGEERRRLQDAVFKGVAYARVFDLGSEGGGIASAERDYLYAVAGERGNEDRQQAYLIIVDVTNPEGPPNVRGTVQVYGAQTIAITRAYNPPFVQTFALVAGGPGAAVVDVTRSDAPMVLARLGPEELRGVVDVAVEEMAFDRLVDWDGRPEKDISHPGARYMAREEILRILRAPLDGKAKRDAGKAEPGTGTGTGTERRRSP